jgi:putative SOS response-associated peptidase YedK
VCSRYEFVPDPRAWVDFREVLGVLADELLLREGRPKLAPTDRVPIVVQQPGGPPQAIDARWGFIPAWWNKPVAPKLCFNARSEEAATKPMWRDALRRNRCLIPATAWTEWQHVHGVKIPHRLQPHDGRGFMFAGLWSLWRPRPDAEAPRRHREDTMSPGFAQGAAQPTCVILTTAASPGIAHVHDRMPVVLEPAAWPAWLDPAATAAAAALELIRRHAVGGIAAITVDRH